jgi:hypothetical protein
MKVQLNLAALMSGENMTSYLKMAIGPGNSDNNLELSCII